MNMSYSLEVIREIVALFKLTHDTLMGVILRTDFEKQIIELKKEVLIIERFVA